MPSVSLFAAPVRGSVRAAAHMPELAALKLARRLGQVPERTRGVRLPLDALRAPPARFDAASC
jgi:hypothetical protein